MRRSINVQSDLEQIHTIEDLTEVFESIASLRISKIRNRVVTSKSFFTELWQTYTELRIDPTERLARDKQASKKSHNVFLAVTSESKLSGEIDESIINTMLEALKDQPKVDIMIVGAHGAAQARQRNLKIAKTFHLPTEDVDINVSEIIEAVNKYNQISVFYQTYESLRLQKVARIELLSAVRELSEGLTEGSEIVSSRDYIFEPNIEEIADYMESFMMGVALIQVIMETKLSQYASRFNTMSSAKSRAHMLVEYYRREYHQTRRSESDERIKETLKAINPGSNLGGRK